MDRLLWLVDDEIRRGIDPVSIVGIDISYGGYLSVQISNVWVGHAAPVWLSSYPQWSQGLHVVLSWVLRWSLIYVA